MARKATDQVTTIGIDIGKNTFHLIGLSYDRMLVTGPSGGVFDKLDAVLEQHSLNDFRELV